MDEEYSWSEDLIVDTSQSDPPSIQDFESWISLEGSQIDDIFAGVPLGENPSQQESSEFIFLDSASSSEVEISLEIFRTYDICGVVSEVLSASVVCEIGRAIGSEAYERGQQSIVVVRDGRVSGPELCIALVEGLHASGRDVINIGMAPTPVLYFCDTPSRN